MENDVHAQVKAYRECDEECKNKGSHVRLESQCPYIDHLFVKQIVVEHVVKKNVEQGVTSPTCSIVICLQGHKPFEHWIEDIQE